MVENPLLRPYGVGAVGPLDSHDKPLPGNSLCPFWDGENVTLSTVVGDL